MKGILRAFAILVGLLLLALIAATFLIDAGQFKPEVEQKLSSSLGRKVSVGRLSLSLLYASLSAEDLSVTDDPAFSGSPFLTAQSITVGVRLLPLVFARTLDITTLRIEKPHFTLLRNREGRWNFSSLGSRHADLSDPPESNGGGKDELIVGRLELIEGRVTLGHSGLRSQSVYQDVNLEAQDVSRDATFPFGLTADLPGGGNLKMEGNAGPLDRTDATLTPFNLTLSIANLDLAKSGFFDSGSGMGGFAACRLRLDSNNARAQAAGEVKLSAMKLVRDGRPAETPLDIQIGATYDALSNAGSLNEGVVKVGGAQASLSGTFDRRSDAIALNLKSIGREMPVKDLESLLPALGVVLPMGARLEEGTADFDLAILGRIDRPVVAGSLDLVNARLAGFDMGAKMSSIEALSGIALGGETVIEKLTSDVHITSDGIQVKDLTLEVPGLGELTGNGTVANNSALNFKLEATLSSSGVVGDLLGALTGRKGRSTRIPFLVKGTTSDPRFLPDVGTWVPF